MGTVRRLVIAFVLIATCGATHTQTIELESIPGDVMPAISAPAFDQKYDLSGAMNPYYLRGDFDGDSKADYAFWIKAKSTGNLGIAIWLSSRKTLTVIGAGIAFRMAGTPSTSFAGLNFWQVYGKRPVEEGVEAGMPPKLIGEAIFIGKSESASGLIYWNGASFRWYQQGD